MKNRLTYILLMLIPLIMFQGTLNAAPARKMFAYGMKINTSGTNALYEFEIPLEIYKTVTDENLHDIRVFNSAGSVVPHIIYTPVEQTKANGIMAAALPFFPIISPQESSADDIEIQIEKDAHGSIIKLKTGNNKNPASSAQRVKSYLVDSGGLKGKPVSALELAWPENQHDFMRKITVDASPDLQSWRRIASATIADLHYGNHRLNRKRIQLTRPTREYLRIRWPNGQEPLSLTKVLAIAEGRSPVARPGYRWTKALVKQNRDNPAHFDIDQGGFLPADRISIRLEDRNSMAAIKLFSGPDKDGNISVKQWAGLVYNLNCEGTPVSNPPVAADGNDRYWRLEFDEGETAITNPPKVEFGWQPQRLLFLAQGEGPFMVAYGSAEAPPPDFKVDPLMRKYQQGAGTIKPTPTSTGPQYVLAGPDQLIPSPDGPPWEKYILWTVMIAGVLAIGWMSVTLYKQLQSAEQNGTEE